MYIFFGRKRYIEKNLVNKKNSKWVFVNLDGLGTEKIFDPMLGVKTKKTVYGYVLFWTDTGYRKKIEHRQAVNKQTVSV